MKSLLAFGTLIVVFGQFITYLITKKRFEGLPSINGVVTHSKLDNYNDVEGKRVYSANLKFKYEVDNKEYESNTAALRSFQIFPFHDYEHELISKYPEGSSISVKYLPETPSKGYLEIAPLSKLSTVALLTVVVVAVGYLIFLGDFTNA